MILKSNSYPFEEPGYYLQLTNGKEPYPYLHSHDFYEMITIANGECTQLINGNDICLKQYSLVLLRPSDTHKTLFQIPKTNLMSLSIKREHMEGFIAAHGRAISDLILSSNQLLYIEFDFKAKDHIENAYHILSSTSAPEKEMYLNIILSNILQSFVLQKYGNLDNTTPRKKQTEHLLFDALNRMNTPENISEGVKALERLSGYSHSQLCRLMKKHLNLTPFEYIHKLRMNFAVNLLEHTDISVSDIAEQVGFSSTSYFISAFKSQFGITPLQKRRYNMPTPHKK